MPGVRQHDDQRPDHPALACGRVGNVVQVARHIALFEGHVRVRHEYVERKPAARAQVAPDAIESADLVLHCHQREKSPEGDGHEGKLTPCAIGIPKVEVAHIGMDQLNRARALSKRPQLFPGF